MIKKITRYIDYIEKTYGIALSIHAPRYSYLEKYMGELAPYNVHSNPYCLYIKGTKECFDACRNNQYRVVSRCTGGTFFGSCMAGVGEYIVPIKKGGEPVGFISVGAFSGDKSKMEKFADEYNYPKNILKEKFENHLNANIPKKELIETIVEPLSLMVELLLTKEEVAPIYDGDSYVYGHIMSYLHSNMSKKITVRDIADSCHYSESYVSKLFKQKSGYTINSYLKKIRIDRAKKLLLLSDMRVSDIAYETGFSDTNYFIACFSTDVGCPPAKYRRVGILNESSLTNKE